MRTQAIILKKIPIKEYDELVVCYTKDAGKQTFRAKSVRRSTSKQASHLDILNFVDFSLVYGLNASNGISVSHPIITSAYTLNSWLNLKLNLSSMAGAYFLLECFDKLVFDGEADMKLWNFFLQKLEGYDILAKNSDINWAQEIKLSHQEFVKIMGYEPSTNVQILAGKQFKSLQFAKKVIR